eukprot:2936937-Pyramimonas_sp.AAC.1
MALGHPRGEPPRDSQTAYGGRENAAACIGRERWRGVPLADSHTFSLTRAQIYAQAFEDESGGQ